VSIFGCVNTDSRPVPMADLEAMAGSFRLLAGTRTASWAEGPAGLGFRGVAFTPEDTADAQPVLAGGGRFVVVADARLDARTDLLGRLGWNDSSHRDRPDSELIAEAWCRWGEGFVSHLYGAFAVAVWDTRDRTLFCARDHLGERALFFSHTGASFAFATMPRALRVLPGFVSRLDEARLGAWMADLSDTDDSFFAGISGLPAGSSVRVHDNSVHHHRYYRLEAQSVPFRSDAEFEEGLRDVLTLAVADRLRSRTPVALRVGVGFDSQAVSTLIARHVGERGATLRAFSSAPWVPELANTETVPLKADRHLLLSGLDGVFDELEEPLRPEEERGIWTDMWEEMRAGGETVLLSTEVANPLFWQEPRLLIPGLVTRLRLADASALLRSQATVAQMSIGRVAYGRVLRPLLRMALVSLDAERRVVTHGPRWLLSGSPIRPDAAVRLGLHRRRGRAHRQWVLQGELKNLHKAGGAPRYEWPRVTHGIDVRHPAADRRVTEYCLGLPRAQWASEHADRSLLLRTFDTAALETAGIRRFAPPPEWWARFYKRREAIMGMLEVMERNPVTSSLVDLPSLNALAEKWPDPSGDPPSRNQWFRLFVGVMAGCFVEWSESGSVPLS
jgi:asparagine synthase (glutamine-hydrolysing)